MLQLHLEEQDSTKDDTSTKTYLSAPIVALLPVLLLLLGIKEGWLRQLAIITKNIIVIFTFLASTLMNKSEDKSLFFERPPLNRRWAKMPSNSFGPTKRRQHQSHSASFERTCDGTKNIILTDLMLQQAVIPQQRTSPTRSSRRTTRKTITTTMTNTATEWALLEKRSRNTATLALYSLRITSNMLQLHHHVAGAAVDAQQQQQHKKSLIVLLTAENISFRDDISALTEPSFLETHLESPCE